ncbi:unnamed protein product, partial [Chrysoparadoxa australica]
MPKHVIEVFEHEVLRIGERGFLRSHWQSFVKLNELHNGQYFEVLHNGLRFKQFVGVVQSGDILVQIHPKADREAEGTQWKGVLLQMLKACGKLRAQDLGNASLRKQNINLLEVYFEQYLSEIELLLHQGLIKRYRQQEGNLTALKGKLQFASNIRHNLVHQERFYTQHSVYDRDHKLHQILASALEVVNLFSRATPLNYRCRKVQLDFPEVRSYQPKSSELNKFHLDRKAAPYQKAFELARFILLHYSPDIHFGKENMIALLFDMNVLWEQYVLKQLKSVSEKFDMQVNGQWSKFFWSHRQIRPDIVLEMDQETIVVDTKW